MSGRPPGWLVVLVWLGLAAAAAAAGLAIGWAAWQLFR